MIGKIVGFLGNREYRFQRAVVFLAALALILGADFLVSREHGVFFWDRVPGWSALYGLVSCVLIILATKFLGQKCGLAKRPDYYD